MASPAPTSADRAPERGVRRLFLRAPAWLYWGPLASAFRWRCILRLTTWGRKSGRPRTTAVSFMPLADGRFVIFSGWGRRSNWYQNVLARPDVEVRVGHERFRGIAQPVEDRAERAALMRQMAARSSRCGPPQPMRPLLKLSRVFDYEAEIARAVAFEGDLPIVVIRRTA